MILKNNIIKDPAGRQGQIIKMNFLLFIMLITLVRTVSTTNTCDLKTCTCLNSKVAQSDILRTAIVVIITVRLDISKI